VDGRFRDVGRELASHPRVDLLGRLWTTVCQQL
jgi:hypothetical protein